MSPRIARVVVQDIPRHIIARGNRRQNTFFHASDFQLYLDYLEQYAPQSGVRIVAYCLMHNHVHLIAVPSREHSFAKLFNEVKRRYSRAINFRHHWRGHLWQGRFSSYPMDDTHLYHDICYVKRNPIAAGLTTGIEEHPWCSAKFSVGHIGKSIIDKTIGADVTANWRQYLESPTCKEMKKDIERHIKTGRPLGSDAFIKNIELATGRFLLPKKPGPRRKLR